MTNSETLLLTLVTMAMGWGVLWLSVGGFYYWRYPFAELLDDAMRLGLSEKLPTLTAMLSMTSSESDVRRSCEALRLELGIRRTTVWEKIVFGLKKR